MLVQLKYKNDVIPGYFISDEGKIYDENGLEQELKIYSRHDYYYFKRHGVHQMMIHSFFGYKEGFDVHHKNEVKSDNRLQNLCYLTHSEHNILHKLGKKQTEQAKEKNRIAHIGRKHSEQSKEKLSAIADKKQVYCLELDRMFESISLVSKELSLPLSNISRCCNGKRKTCGGYHFQFVNV